MEYTVSLMTLADVDDVVEIERQSFPIPWSRAAFIDELTRNERALYVVIRDESGTMVGYGGMWLVCDEAHVTNIAVRSDRRRHGVGTAIMVGLMGFAQSKGADRMTLEVRVSNLPAQELYRGLGFVPAGVRPRYYIDNREDALIMWLDGISGALQALCGRQDADVQ
ncbi:MAG TPA: ribosomal protein S18-alanine N-acetyltransferase [Bacillota bacterium]|jgi:ribosomal-protein-alanine N-acetyltransferase|nr:ribosomal protein S18-alanine N-acetyltransferase [Bacillota bacterium]